MLAWCTKWPPLREPISSRQWGHYGFHQIQPDLFNGFEPHRETGNFDIATPEKALFDTLYLSTRKGRRFSHRPEVELPDTFSWDLIEGWTDRIEHDPLRIVVRERWTALRESVSDVALA